MKFKLPDGRTVVATEPVHAPIRTPAGEPIVFKQQLRLLLDDGSEVFGCVTCGETRDKTASLRNHIGHAHGKGRRLSDVTTADVLDMTLADALAALAGLADANGKVEAVEKVAADRDQWKDRALRAERTLGQWKKLIATVSGEGK